MPAPIFQDGVEEELLQLFSVSQDPVSSEMAIEKQVSTIVQRFLSSIEVSTNVELGALVEKFKDTSIPHALSADVASYINYLSDNVVEHSTHTSSPRFIGHMTSALPYFVRPLGKLMTAMNQNVVKMETARVLSLYERQTIGMMHRLIYGCTDAFYEQHVQQRQSTLGMMVSGGTLANLTALWCARNVALGPKDGFAGIEQAGLPTALEAHGYKGIVVLGSKLMHYSLKKGVDVLGLGARNLLEVKVDGNHRIDPVALQRTVAECRDRKQCIIAIVGIAGTTDCGSVDPLSELARIAREHNIHFHVDAAWGGPLLFSGQHRRKLAGIELADSVTIDGHKQLYSPMGIGLVLLRNPHTAKAIEKQAPYIVRKLSADLGKRALEGSRAGMTLFLHAALNILGQKGFEILIDNGIRKTQYLADLIRSLPQFELVAEPQINILVYRYIPKRWRKKAKVGELTEAANQAINLFNERLQKTQRQAGKSFVSRTSLETTYDGNTMTVVALRAVIANPLTTESDIDIVLKDQIKLAREVAGFEGS
jgi:glutamate decarboxylase